MKPILFNTEMVRAILGGRKTQTRRLVKPQPIGFTGRNFIFADDECPKKWEQCDDFISTALYHTGDILWVRETWSKISDWSEVDPAVGIPDGFIYRADWPDGEDGPKWHPSIHMPREAARIFLRVTDVRVERLWEIMDVPPGPDNPIVKEGVKYGCDFIAVWENTIKPADRDRYGWDANPWVWVICFKRIPKEAAE